MKVENINPNVSSDHLQLLFGKGGEEVEDTEMNEEDQSAILTFQDPKGKNSTKRKRNDFSIGWMVKKNVCLIYVCFY